MNEERKLGYIESHMHLMHQMFNGTTQSIAMLGVNGPLTLAGVTAAVERVQQAHELLSCHIRRDKAELYFEPGPDAVDVSAVPRQSADTWQAVFHAANALPLRGRLWRVIVVLGGPEADAAHEILVIAHHAVMDGFALNVFLNAVLSELADAGAEARAGLPRRAIPPPAEMALGSTVPWPQFLESRAAARARQQTDFIAHAATAALSERRTRTLFCDLSGSLTRVLQQRCQAASATLNSWLSAAFLLAVKRVVPEKCDFTLNTAFSLRRACAKRVSTEDLGCYLAVVATQHRLANVEASVRDLAGEHKRLLIGTVMRDSKQPSSFELQALEAGLKPLAEASVFSHDLGITYAEPGLPEQFGALTVSSYYVSINRCLGNLAAVLHGILHRGRLHLTLNFVEPLRSSAWGRAVLAELQDILQRGVTEPSSLPAPQLRGA
jgi:hypothetical protein